MSVNFDAGALLARARRLAGVSQRELAAAAGVAPSTVGGIESGARRAGVELLDTLFRATGLRLAVLDSDGTEVSPVPVDAVRDGAGRRFPAHLDVLPRDRLAAERMGSPRYDRASTVAGYRLRPHDERSCGGGGASLAQVDHPTLAELEFGRQHRLYGRSPSWPRRAQELAKTLGVDLPEDVRSHHNRTDSPDLGD